MFKPHLWNTCFLAFILALIVTTVVISACAGSSNKETITEPSAPEPYTMAQTTNETYENNKVYMGIWLNNIYSFEYTKGTYTLDIFLYFFWIDPNIKEIDWYLMNGYPVNPATIEILNNDTSGEVKNQIFRITAVCSTTPDASSFPFDPIQMEVVIELITRGYHAEIVWLENQTGVDPSFDNAGWVTSNIELISSNRVYPLGVELPRAEMILTQYRLQIWTGIQALIPPVIFALVSAFSFLFSLRDAAAVGLRLGLETSMLVTTLLFNFTVNSTIPPSSTITLYSLFMLSILIFMVMNLVVTVIGFVQWFYYKNEKQTKRTNRWGFIISLLVLFAFFILLYLLRA